jgi:hypothetical protein
MPEASLPAVGLDDRAGEVGTGRRQHHRLGDVVGGGDAPGRQRLGRLGEVRLPGLVGQATPPEDVHQAG